MGKIRLTQFMPKVWEKLQTCVQDRRDMKLGRKKSEPWLGKGVVNNPSKAWDIWYAIQCERSKSGNQLGWREASMGRCWRCRFQSHLHHVVQSWQSLALRGGRGSLAHWPFFRLCVGFWLEPVEPIEPVEPLEPVEPVEPVEPPKNICSKNIKLLFFSVFFFRRFSGGQPFKKIYV